MASLSLHPATIAPMPAIARIMSRFDRPQLEGFIAVALDLIDTLDGDTDIELNGDETDNDHSEDCFKDFSAYGSGPGCTVGDPDREHDGREEDDEH